MMKFKKVERRKIYETWVSTRRYMTCKVYIMKFPEKDAYHFQVICDDDIVYISLVDGLHFNAFDSCVNAAKEWIEKNIK